MMHKGFPDVKDQLYRWRDAQGVIHVSTRADTRTFCGLHADVLTYAGRLSVPTCLECVSAA